jgi:hypothetical protein
MIWFLILTGLVAYGYLVRWLAHGMARWWTRDTKGHRLRLTRGNYISMWLTCAIPIIGTAVGLIFTIPTYIRISTRWREWLDEEVETHYLIRSGRVPEQRRRPT